MERIRRKKARQAEMAASGEGPIGDGTGMPGGGSVASEESSVPDITNTKSAKKHRNFLRDSLKGVESEIMASEKYIKIDKEQVDFAHEHGAFEALTEAEIKKRNINPELTEADYVPTGKVRKKVNINDEVTTATVDVRDLDNSGTYGRGGGIASAQGSRPGTDARPGTTASVGGRPPRSGLKSAEGGHAPDEMFVAGEGSIGSLEGSSESALLKNWGVDKPLRAEAPALDPNMTQAADSLRNMMAK